jgi:putative ABC transport system permease protein
MSTMRQIRAVTEMELRSIPVRLGTSMVIVVGVGVVVAVLVSALAVASGFTRAAAATGDPSRAIVLSGETEAGSSISRENAVAILNARGVASERQGVPLASAEALVFVPLTNRNTGMNAFVTLRGVGSQAPRLRPEIRIAEGRMFASGAHEVMVGRAAQRRLGGLEVGSSIALPNGEWSVVGIFTSDGDSHESELMTDAETLLNAYQRNVYNSITVRLGDGDAFEEFATALAADPTLAVTAVREDDYFAAASQQVARLLTVIAYGMGGIMAFGAAFGALNTMYSAVSTRAKEIATLRAIGFGSPAVVVSVLAEALALALAGALLGALVAFLALDGSAMSTMTGDTPSQLTFDLAVGLDLMLIGVACAAAIAAVGGLFGAVRAARVPVAAALRMTY